MALTATIYKAELQIADMERAYYDTLNVTVARHPSETDERMMVRLVAFALHAAEALQFTRGLCADDEPDIWQKGLTDEIDVWIDVGQPDEKHIRKACNRARQVYVYAYAGRAAQLWWERIRAEVSRFGNLHIINLDQAQTPALAALAARSMRLQCTIQEGQVWLGNSDTSVMVELERWYDGSGNNT